MDQKLFESEITCIDIAPISEGRSRSRYAVIGCADKTVKVLCLDQEACLSKISVQALPTEVSAVCLVEMNSAMQGEGESK